MWHHTAQRMHACTCSPAGNAAHTRSGVRKLVMHWRMPGTWHDDSWPELNTCIWGARANATSQRAPNTASPPHQARESIWLCRRPTEGYCHNAKDCSCPGGGKDPNREESWKSYRERKEKAVAEGKMKPGKGKSDRGGKGEGNGAREERDMGVPRGLLRLWRILTFGKVLPQDSCDCRD